MRNDQRSPLFTLEQLRAFIAVAEAKSYTLGAKALKRDRTTVREHVENLELSLNLDLIIRNGPKITITPKGQEFLRGAIALMHSAYRLDSYAQSLVSAEQVKDEYTVAVCECIPPWVISSIIKEIRSQYPMVSLNWVTKGFDEAQSSLRVGKVDATIVRVPPNHPRLIPESGIESCYLGSMPGSIYVGATSQVLQLTEVKMKDLSHQVKYILGSFTSKGEQTKGSYSIQEVKMGSYSQIISALMLGDGWAFLPDFIAKPYVQNNEIKAINASFMNDSWSIEHAVNIQSSLNNPFLSLFWDTVKTQYKKGMKSV